MIGTALRHRLSRTAAAGMLFAAGVMLVAPSSAGALVTSSHSFHVKGNMPDSFGLGSGRAIETKANLLVKCNAKTGAYTLKLKNFSAIDEANHSMNLDGNGQVSVMIVLGPGIFGGETFDLALTQNAVTELFDGMEEGVMTAPALCASGQPVVAVAFGATSWPYSVSGALT